MSCARKNCPQGRSVVRHLPALLLACATLLAAPAALAIDSGDIIVVSLRGEVHITVNGAARKLPAGGVLELPATVRTGRNGNIELRQGATSVNVGPETLLEFPALEKRGAPVDRILQPRGNAFYNIGKREGRKLRVETPYLVGVIKGTQFNVAAGDDRTTISLFEGALEIHASGDNDVVDLEAGEIASRSRGDQSISILKMDAGKPPPTTLRAPAKNGPADGTSARVTPPATAGNESHADEGTESLLVDREANRLPADLGVSTDLRNDAEWAANTPVSVSPPVVDVGADPGASTAIDVPAVTVDVSAGIAVDTGVSADVGAGAVDTSSGAGMDAGPLTTDLGAGVAVDLPSGTVDADAGVIVGASAPLVEVNVGADAAVDAVAGTVNGGLDVGGANLDLGVDLGLDDGNSGHGNDEDHSDSSNPGRGNNSDTTNVDVGGLLDGLTRRSTKK